MNLAFSHRSFANESAGEVDNNEKLEFFGDSVLGLVVSEYLMIALPDKSDKSRIDMDSVRAFRLPAGKAVVLKPFVWHYAPLVKDGPVKTFVVFEENTPDNDLHMRYTDQEQEIIFKVEGM